MGASVRTSISSKSAIPNCQSNTNQPTSHPTHDARRTRGDASCCMPWKKRSKGLNCGSARHVSSCDRHCCRSASATRTMSETSKDKEKNQFPTHQQVRLDRRRASSWRRRSMSATPAAARRRRRRCRRRRHWSCCVAPRRRDARKTHDTQLETRRGDATTTHIVVEHISRTGSKSHVGRQIARLSQHSS